MSLRRMKSWNRSIIERSLDTIWSRRYGGLSETRVRVSTYGIISPCLYVIYSYATTTTSPPLISGKLVHNVQRPRPYLARARFNPTRRPGPDEIELKTEWDL